MDEATVSRLRASEELRRNRQRGAVAGLIIGTLVFALAIVLLDGRGDPGVRLLLQVMIGVGAVITVGGIWGTIAFGPNRDTEQLMRADGYRDRIQKQRAKSIQFMPLACLLLNYRSIEATLSVLSGQAGYHDWWFAGFAPLTSVMILAMVAGLDNPGDKKMKRLLEDELTLSFRRRALMLAMAVGVFGLIVVFGVGLWRPVWGVAGMPVLLAVVAAVAAFRYAMLDRQADPNG